MVELTEPFILVVGSYESAAGVPLTSYVGCYHATEFWLRDGSGPPAEDPDPDCSGVGESFAGPDTSVLQGLCTDVTSESYWCLTTTSSGVAVLGLDTGDLCTFLPWQSKMAGGGSSIAWLGPYLFSHGGIHEVLQKHSLIDGYDTWVNGMSVVDGMLVLAATWPEGRVVVFDAPPGLALWEVQQSTHIGGLVCLPAL